MWHDKWNILLVACGGSLSIDSNNGSGDNNSSNCSDSNSTSNSTNHEKVIAIVTI